jgi:Na+/H+-dicarboxylate symporter
MWFVVGMFVGAFLGYVFRKPLNPVFALICRAMSDLFKRVT